MYLGLRWWVMTTGSRRAASVTVPTCLLRSAVVKVRKGPLHRSHPNGIQNIHIVQIFSGSRKLSLVSRPSPWQTAGDEGAARVVPGRLLAVVGSREPEAVAPQQVQAG